MRILVVAKSPPTSDAGVMLLSEADKKLKLTERIAAKFNDPRCRGKCDHSLLDLLRQRVYKTIKILKILIN